MLNYRVTLRAVGDENELFKTHLEDNRHIFFFCRVNSSYIIIMMNKQILFHSFGWLTNPAFVFTKAIYIMRYTIGIYSLL